MRVVGGEARGRRLLAPPGTKTRPTSDRVREAVFDMLASLGGVEGLAVADLFAGSGALGVEALSRGAGSCAFVESDPAAVRVIADNLRQIGLNGGEIVRDDVLRWVERAGPVDIALMDPPYAFDRWDDLFARLDAAVAVVESDRPVDPGPGWEVLREKHYGDTVVLVIRRQKGGA
jgi:16S rRNA (guanine966-N2)-methyltransferase